MPDEQPAPVGGPLPRGHLLALNRSFRRTLEAENKSPRTIEAYTDAVRLLATYCQAHRMPLPAVPTGTRVARADDLAASPQR